MHAMLVSAWNNYQQYLQWQEVGHEWRAFYVAVDAAGTVPPHILMPLLASAPV